MNDRLQRDLSRVRFPKAFSEAGASVNLNEHRPATIMFTDVEGSTKLRTRYGDEVAQRLLRAAEDVVRAELARNGGREIKTMGDGFMIEFASPRSAVSCAVGIQRSLDEQRRAGAAVHLRIGINTGEVTRAGGDVHGESVHLAARIEAKAKGGQILVSEVVRQLVGTMPGTVFRDRGRVGLKGFPERRRLFEVGWEKSEPAPQQPPKPGAQVLCPVVVGRQQETAALEAAVVAARQGHGRIVFLTGEAGIGKSRLAREADTLARSHGMLTLRGRAVAGAVPVPYRPLAEAFQSVVRTGKIPDSTDLGAYRAALGRLIPDWKTDAPDDDSGFLLLEALVRLLRTLAGDTGVLLVLEDLHWSDSDTLSVVEYLADNLTEERVLVVCTARDDEPGPGTALVELLAARRVASRFELTRLGDDGVAEMARASLGAGVLQAEVLAAVTQRAEGVPFVVEEMLSAYLASDRQSPTPLLASALPPTYRDLVRKRLSALDPVARRVVDTAAVLGRNFDWAVLAAATELERGQVLSGLRAALAAQLVTTQAEAGLSTPFVFRHALVRDAIVAEMLSPERVPLALRLADAIEDIYPGLPGDWCERAADLRQSAEDRDGAARLLLEAGKRALDRGALATAETTLERARSLMTGDRWRLLGIDRVLVDVLAHAGKSARLREIGEGLLGLMNSKAGSIGTPMRVGHVHLQIARGVAAASDWETAKTHLERARALATEAADELLLARIDASAGSMAVARWQLGDADAHADRALEAARRLAIDDVECEALIVQGQARYRRGDADGALSALEAARAHAEHAGLPMLRINALMEIGSIRANDGGDVDALVEASRAATESGAVSAQARLSLLIGFWHLSRYELDRAAAHLDRAVEMARRYRLGILPRVLASRAYLSANSLRAEESEGWIAEALALAPQSATVEAAAHGARGQIAMLNEERAAAIVEMNAALETLRAGNIVVLFPFPALRACLHALDERGETERAIEECRRYCLLMVRENAALLTAAGAIAAGRAGNREEAVALAAEADEAAAPNPFARHLIRRFLAEGMIAHAWGEPATPARQALAWFEAAGLDRLAAASRALLRKAGGAVPRKGRGESAVPSDLHALGVTSREVDVLRLLGEGMTNADIGARLFVSPRTIETHVGALLRKTGLDSRAHLIAFAARILNYGTPAG